MQDEKPAKDDMPKHGYRWIGAGIEFCGVIGLFSYMGYRLDGFLDSSPFLLITGFLISFIGMVYIFYKDSI